MPQDETSDIQPRRPFLRILLTPFQQFVQSESASGLLLIVTAIVAFAWANSRWADAYLHMREIAVGVSWGHWNLQGPPEFWVNGALMTIFFLVVGLEIKREVLVGELAGIRRALWPAVAALGGMVVPATFYAAVNWNGPALRGWGIPMATDIAFALGVISLLGSRVPASLKVFLTALAIVDDLGAVLVIAFFYTEQLHLVSLGLALLVTLLCAGYGWLGGRRLSVFCVLGLFLWYFMHESGVHATVAGVLLALTIPIGSRTRELPRRENSQNEQEFEQAEAAMQAIEYELEHAQSPLHRLEHALVPWAAFFIMPVFALFNAGISLAGGGATISAVNVGVFLGLLLGKPIGIVGATWLAHRFGLILLPQEAGWPAMIGVGLLGGIGFTMSLFIAMLAFAQDPILLDQAKLGVLATSVVAAIAGLLVLIAATGRRT